MRQSPMKLVFMCCALILGVALVGTMPARAQVSTGEIQVRAADSDSAVLPGVTVTVVNQDTGFRRVGVTGAQGTVAAIALPVGTYSLTAELDGFAPVSQDDLTLLVGQTLRVNLTMRVQVSETITVSAEAPLVDVYRTDSSTNIVPEQIEQLPVADRDFEKLAFIAPGVQRERGEFRFIGGGPVIGAGGNASQSTILVDGVDLTDQALGLSRTRFSQDAIREFRVISNRFDSEIGGSAGGALSIVTRSGTNETHGSVFGFYRADSLRAKREMEQDKLDFSRYQAGVTVGGPIVEDRTHYFLSFEYIDQNDISLVRPGGSFAGQARDVDHPFEQKLGLLSLDHQIAQSASLSAKLVYETYDEENFRVGGIDDVSYGQQLLRDNLNLTISHVAVLQGDRLNELRGQIGNRKYEEPTNSDDPTEWFSGGATLRSGSNIVGDLLGDGDYLELRDTFHWMLDGSRGTHDIKAGAGWSHIKERSRIDTFQEGLFIYASDLGVLPLVYIYGVGSSDVDVTTDIYSAFVQDDWRPLPNLTLSLGVRYDLDTDGNNPDFEHPLVGDRSADDDNFQPRIGFNWDINNDGTSILRGGAGVFTGRYLLVPAFTELQQNGISGRVTYQRLSGAVLGLPASSGTWIDPADPEHTGIGLPPDITLLEDNLEAPETVQLTLGYSRRLGGTGMVLDVEGIYVDGENEIVVRDTNFGGNDNPVRLNPIYNQISTYTNDGHSLYKALVVGLNGTISGGHLVTASMTFADKKNIADDFSPAFPYGYPSDPANIEGEYGRSRGDERFRLVVSGIFRLPWDLTLAPIYEYGDGQPWNRVLGYDANGDGRASDRAEGVERNDQDGPSFKQLSLRLTKTFVFGDTELDLIVEGFNILNNTNYDVTSVDNIEYLGTPATGLIPNPTYGTYRDTLSSREVQLGLRYRF